MTCEWRDKRSLYVDGELEQAGQQAFAGHLQSCNECSSAVQEQQELKKAVRLAGKRYSAPPELYASLRKGIPQRGTRGWVRWGLIAVSLMIVAAIGLGWLLSRHGEDATIAQLVDQHITTIASANPIDVVSEDRHTVKPWFQGKLPFTFNVPELNNSGFKLLGGKMVYAQHAPGAELLLQVRQHKISVFIFQARDVHGRAATTNAFVVNGWEQGGLQYYIVTDAAGEDTEKLRALFEQANRS